MCLIHFIAGAFNHQPEELHLNLSPSAKDLIKRAFGDLDTAALVDYHTHIAGIGTSNTGILINPRLQSWTHPLSYLRFKVYLSAAAVTDVEHADTQVVDRLVRLITSIEHHGKYRLLAFDKHYGRDGTVNLEKTEFMCRMIMSSC
jgi:hypothetical protein